MDGRREQATGRPGARLRPRVVLFDLDGTLSDSAPGILASLRHAFAVTGVPPLDAQTEQALLGPPFYDSLPPYLGDVPLDAVIAAYRERYGREGMYDTAPYDGMRQLLEDLRGGRVTMAVATSKPEPYAVPIVEHLGLGEFFATVGGDELDGSLRTKALVIGKVLRRLGDPDPADVLMVGDRVHDVAGAREHGIAAIGAGWGYGLPGELQAARPLAICPTPRELHRLLDLDGTDAAAS
ncbi:MAG: phosphoglycolate phosphatase [Pseudonocardiales bacterium]|nr:phosphoglycolate phosphatase [Pseudonocardiales bacterium]